MRQSTFRIALKTRESKRPRRENLDVKKTQIIKRSASQRPPAPWTTSLLATDWERKFASDLLSLWSGQRILSERQRFVLNRAYKKCAERVRA